MQLLQLFALSLGQEVGVEEERMYRGRQGSVGTDRVPVSVLQLVVNCVDAGAVQTVDFTSDPFAQKLLFVA